LHEVGKLHSPAAASRDLYRMVNRGPRTVEETRDLIAVPPAAEDALRAYADRYPEEAWEIEGILQFRQRVAEEFEILVADASHDVLGFGK
jgi:hypothetical protein